jgi:3-deoxy-D-manno-octulosonic acid kinase
MLSEARVWGAIPGGFKKIAEDSRGFYLLVREDRASEIDLSILDAARTLQASDHHGRAPLRSLRLRDGETALIRNYRHGGLLQGLRGAWYASWPPRPFRELAITEELRRRGFPTVEVYAAAVERGWGPFYRGCLVSREVHGSKDLWSALQDPAMNPSTLGVILRAAADTIVAMHRHGVYHADLNLKNILVRYEHGSVESYVIDFDRAKLFLGKLPPLLARNNLNRLLRSARKLDPGRRFLAPAAWNQFLDHYYGTFG